MLKFLACPSVAAISQKQDLCLEEAPQVEVRRVAPLQQARDGDHAGVHRLARTSGWEEPTGPDSNPPGAPAADACSGSTGDRSARRPGVRRPAKSTICDCATGRSNASIRRRQKCSFSTLSDRSRPFGSAPICGLRMCVVGVVPCGTCQCFFQNRRRGFLLHPGQRDPQVAGFVDAQRIAREVAEQFGDVGIADAPPRPAGREAPPAPLREGTAGHRRNHGRSRRAGCRSPVPCARARSATRRRISSSSGRRLSKNATTGAPA